MHIDPNRMVDIQAASKKAHQHGLPVSQTLVYFATLDLIAEGYGLWLPRVADLERACPPLMKTQVADYFRRMLKSNIFYQIGDYLTDDDVTLRVLQQSKLQTSKAMRSAVLRAEGKNTPNVPRAELHKQGLVDFTNEVMAHHSRPSLQAKRTAKTEGKQDMMHVEAFLDRAAELYARTHALGHPYKRQATAEALNRVCMQVRAACQPLAGGFWDNEEGYAAWMKEAMAGVSPEILLNAAIEARQSLQEGANMRFNVFTTKLRQMVNNG